jgi:hypothetical protein
MATATVLTSTLSGARKGSPLRAAALSVLGAIGAIGIAAVGLLVIPVALAVVFLPPLLGMF